MRGLAFSPEDEQFLETVAAFVAKEVEPVAATVDADDRYPPELTDRLAELDLFGLGVSPALGGSGAALPTSLEGIARVATASASSALLLVGTHAAGAAVAPDLDPPAGWRLDGPVAVLDGGAAIRAEDAGGKVVLSGEARRVVHALRAERLVAVADGPGGRGTYLLDMTADGVRVGPRRETTGLRATSAAAVILDQAPAVARLGGAADAARLRRWQWLGAAAVAAGLSRRAVAESRDYMGERRQFGRFLHEFPVLAAMLERLEEQLWAAESAIGAASGVDASNPESLAAARRSAGRACRTAVDICLDAIQLHGGYGYITEYTVERLLRDAVSLRAGVATPAG